jgi:putative membrane protein
MKILFSIILNAIILFIIAYFLESFPDNTGVLIANWEIAYDSILAWKTYILWWIILWLINLTIKPVLKILTLPLFFIFLSFVSFIVNAIILYLLDYIFKNFLIISWVWYQINWTIEFIIAVIIFTFLNIIYSILFFKK